MIENRAPEIGTLPLVAALPMYDWPECRFDVDAQWATLRDRFRAAGIAAPETLARRNADLPPVPGGIRDRSGSVIAPDPATLPPDALDLHTLWRHPALLFAQTCWGPLQQGLDACVTVVGQDDYSGIPGCSGETYRSVLVMRREEPSEWSDLPPPDGAAAALPLPQLSGRRLAFNATDSMSGYLALKADLEQAGSGLDVFSALVETGAHRASLLAVADFDADIAAIDAKTWHMAGRFEPAAASLAVIGWTAGRRGLPFIATPKLAKFYSQNVLPFSPA